MMPLALITTISSMMLGIYLSFWIDSTSTHSHHGINTIFVYALVQKNILIKAKQAVKLQTIQNEIQQHANS